jgi:hypothetical protein
MKIVFQFNEELKGRFKKFWDSYLQGIDANLYELVYGSVKIKNKIIIKLTTDSIPIRPFLNLYEYCQKLIKTINVRDNKHNIINNYSIIINNADKGDILTITDSNNPLFANIRGCGYVYETNRPSGDKIYNDISKEELDHLIKSNYYFIRRIDENCKYNDLLFIDYLMSITSSVNGINRVDKIYLINLEHRKDRLESILGELKKVGALNSKIKRINAVYFKDFGAIGCGMSHRLALIDAIRNNFENSLILEDDFILSVKPNEFNNYLERAYEEVKSWDVLMLSVNIEQYLSTEFSYLFKLQKGRTTSGYIINKSLLTQVENNFKEAIELMKKYKDSTEDVLVKHNFAIDMYWQKLQPMNKWYCFNPRLGEQMPSYSDVENKFTQYGV